MTDLHDAETRVTDPDSGGQKGKKLTQVGALDPVALIQLARVAGMGADKYSAHNYLRGYDYSLSFNAMMRHALLFWSGEDNDPESGLPHMAHAAWMAMSLVSFVERSVGNDDRPPRFGAESVKAADPIQNEMEAMRNELGLTLLLGGKYRLPGLEDS